MNLAQRLVLIVAFLLTLTMVLFPPWKRLYDVEDAATDKIGHIERANGYHLILQDQFPGSDYSNLRIDTTRLGVQFIGLFGLTFLLCLALRRQMAK